MRITREKVRIETYQYGDSIGKNTTDKTRREIMTIGNMLPTKLIPVTSI